MLGTLHFADFILLPVPKLQSQSHYNTKVLAYKNSMSSPVPIHVISYSRQDVWQVFASALLVAAIKKQNGEVELECRETDEYTKLPAKNTGRFITFGRTLLDSRDGNKNKNKNKLQALFDLQPFIHVTIFLTEGEWLSPQVGLFMKEETSLPSDRFFLSAFDTVTEYKRFAEPEQAGGQERMAICDLFSRVQCRDMTPFSVAFRAYLHHELNMNPMTIAEKFLIGANQATVVEIATKMREYIFIRYECCNKLLSAINPQTHHLQRTDARTDAQTDALTGATKKNNNIVWCNAHIPIIDWVEYRKMRDENNADAIIVIETVYNNHGQEQGLLFEVEATEAYNQNLVACLDRASFNKSEIHGDRRFVRGSADVTLTSFLQCMDHVL